MKRIAIVFLFLVFATLPAFVPTAVAQEVQQVKPETDQKPTEPTKAEPVKQEQQEGFSSTEETDPLRGNTMTVYQLRGKFLKKPQRVSTDVPVIILKCQKGRFKFGTAAGKLVAGYIYIGDVVGSGGASAGVHVQYKLDGGKLQDGYWNASNDFSSIFFSDVDLDNLFYGHYISHKPDTGPQVQKILIGVEEFLGGEVVMGFDLPNIEAVADSCGCINHVKDRIKK